MCVPNVVDISFRSNHSSDLQLLRESELSYSFTRLWSSWMGRIKLRWNLRPNISKLFSDSGHQQFADPDVIIWRVFVLLALVTHLLVLRHIVSMNALEA